MFSIVLLLASIVAAQTVKPAQPPGALTLAVKGGGSHGTLTFTTDGIAFEAADAKKARRWPYLELKQVRIVSARNVALDTYEDGRRWRFGADRSIAFEVSEGAIDGRLVAFLLENVQKPVMSAVLPDGIGDPHTRVDAKHLRGRKGTHGMLVIYAAGLSYETDDTAGVRYWRFSDIESILRTSRFRLLIDVYERGSVRPFEFELKAPLPDAAFDNVWQKVNSPADRTGGVR